MSQAKPDVPREPMCCTRTGRVERRAFLASLLAAIGAACAGPTDDASVRRQTDLLAQGADIAAGAPTVDLHTHRGGFLEGAPLAPARITEMAAAGVHAAFFAAVSDLPVLAQRPGAFRQYREPVPGELRRSTLRQLERIRDRVGEGQLVLVRSPGDIVRARRAGRPAALIALEGGDALDGDPRRVAEFRQLGVRSIQLVHYRINELGDIQTEPPRHGGLTPAGTEVGDRDESARDGGRRRARLARDAPRDAGGLP